MLSPKTNPLTLLRILEPRMIKTPGGENKKGQCGYRASILLQGTEIHWAWSPYPQNGTMAYSEGRRSYHRGTQLQVLILGSTWCPDEGKVNRHPSASSTLGGSSGVENCCVWDHSLPRWDDHRLVLLDLSVQYKSHISGWVSGLESDPMGTYLKAGAFALGVLQGPSFV